MTLNVLDNLCNVTMMFFNEIGGVLKDIAFWLIYCLFVLPIVLSGSLDSLLDILSLLR